MDRLPVLREEPPGPRRMSVEDHILLFYDEQTRRMRPRRSPGPSPGPSPRILRRSASAPPTNELLNDIKSVRTRHTSSTFLSPDDVFTQGGETNFAFDAASDTGSANKTTIVSFVINDEEEKHGDCSKDAKKTCKKAHRSSVSVLLSVLYAIVLIAFGLIFPVTEALRKQWLADHVVGIYLVYLFSVSSIFLLYLQYTSHMEQRKNRHLPHASPRSDAEEGAEKVMEKAGPEKSSPGNASPNIMVLRRRQSVQAEDVSDLSGSRDSAPSGPVGDDRSLSAEGYDLNQEIIESITFKSQTASLGHGAASAYLRLGALLFGVGNLVYVSLELQYYIGSRESMKCEEKPLTYPMIFQIFFLVIQTFTILKNTQVNIKKYKGAARFGFMHVFATNLCVWLRILVKEVQEGLHHNHEDSHNALSSWLPEMGKHSKIYASGADTNSSGGGGCIDPNSLLSKASPFLFPFVLEYCLIAVAVMAGMFQGLSVRVTRDVIESIRKTLRERNKMLKQESKSVQSQAHGQEHAPMLDKSHRGLFFAFLVLTGAVISIVLFFHYNNLDESYMAIGIYQITSISITVLLIVAVIVALMKFYRLQFTNSRDNTIDDRLLLISFAGLFLLEAFLALSSLAYVSYKTDPDPQGLTVSWLGLSSSLLTMTQALLQTIFVIDGLQRYSAEPEVQNRKPGRGTVTFLLISNVTLWIFKTFQVKELDINTPAQYFGQTPWAIIFNINLPLSLFFRFHSSVCLADIWSCAYEGDTDYLEETELSEL